MAMMLIENVDVRDSLKINGKNLAGVQQTSALFQTPAPFYTQLCIHTVC